MYARFKNINIFNILTTMISSVFPFSKRIDQIQIQLRNFSSIYKENFLRKRTIFYENRFS